jgi:hypothetical protein
MEKKVELFCHKLKYSFLKKLREKLTNGKWGMDTQRG